MTSYDGRRWNVFLAALLVAATPEFGAETIYDADVGSMVKDLTGGDFPEFFDHACVVLSQLKARDANRYATVEEVQLQRTEDGGLCVAVFAYSFDLGTTQRVVWKKR
jgi:hypothetical protein